MNKQICFNSLKALGVVVIVAGFSGNTIAFTPHIPNTSKPLVADLPTSLPPANLPGNSRTTVTVPPLSRPEVLQAPANKKPSNLPSNQVPTVQTIPAASRETETSADFAVPQIIEFGQPLPQKRG